MIYVFCLSAFLTLSNEYGQVERFHADTTKITMLEGGMFRVEAPLYKYSLTASFNQCTLIRTDFK